MLHYLIPAAVILIFSWRSQGFPSGGFHGKGILPGRTVGEKFFAIPGLKAEVLLVIIVVGLTYLIS